MIANRLLLFAIMVGGLKLLGSDASAQVICPSTAISNGSPADATLVTSWFSCKAPSDNPTFTGNFGINQTTPLLASLNLTGNQFVTGTNTGSATIGPGQFNLQVGPAQNRNPAANSYYAGIAFNHLLNFSGGGTYNNSPQAWIGTRLYDIPGSERDYLVFATKPSTGTSDVPIERMAIDPFGNVGINTMTPGQTLDVAGTIRQSTCTTAGTLSANTSGDIICTSDARLKSIYGNYTGGLNAIMRIQPKLFSLKPSKSDPVEAFVHAGFIAQNVKTVIPQASALQRGGYYSLDTTAILAAAVNSIKQLKYENDRQAAQIRLLIARVGTLERVRIHLAQR